MFVLPPLLGLHPQTPSVEAKLAGPGAGTSSAPTTWAATCWPALSGAHVSLAIGFGSVLIAAVIGIPIGMFAAYLGGTFSAVATFIVDVILAFPGLILALALTAFIGPSFLSVLVAITVPMMPASRGWRRSRPPRCCNASTSRRAA